MVAFDEKSGEHQGHNDAAHPLGIMKVCTKCANSSGRVHAISLNK